MRQLAVFSGKGGTGKTSLVASFAHLAGDIVAVDCDVDAANLALLLQGDDSVREPFLSGEKATIDVMGCFGCGLCARSCRFDAIEPGPRGEWHVVELACEGCHVCEHVCPARCITFTPNQAGEWFVRRTSDGWLVHASLGVAQDNSGKLVAHVRQQARDLAEHEGLELILVDGPPGIGCPVHAAMGQIDHALVVTEPSLSGVHDLDRILDTAKHFGVRASVAVNKWDLSPELTEILEEHCRARGVQILGRVPFDPEVPRLLSRQELPLDSPNPATRDAIVALWEALVTS